MRAQIRSTQKIYDTFCCGAATQTVRNSGQPPSALFIMTSIESLPLEIWYLLFQYLNVGDLYSLSQSFPDSSKALMGESISLQTVYEMLNLNVSIPQLYIMSDRVLWRHQLFMRHDFRGSRRLPLWEGYRTEMDHLTQVFYPTWTSSAVEMIFHSNYFARPYCPATYGGEPLEPTHVEIHLNNNSDGTPPWYALTYATSYDKYGSSLDKSTHTVKDIHHHELYKTRTVGQTLRLKRAIYRWKEVIPPTGRWKHKQPYPTWKTEEMSLELFKSLGLGAIHVEAVFDKRALHSEKWPTCESFARSITCWFDNLKLPIDPSLLKLSPKEGG